MLLSAIKKKLYSWRLKAVMGVVKTLEVQRFEQPFPYVIVDNLFPEDFYRSLCKQFQSALNRGLSETQNINLFSRIPNYDAYLWMPVPNTLNPSDIFSLPEWLDFLASFFPTVKRTTDTNYAYHYHKAGGQS